MKTSSLGVQDCEVLHCRNVEKRGTRLLASLSCFIFAFRVLVNFFVSLVAAHFADGVLE